MKRNLTGQGFHPRKLEDPDEIRRARLNRPQLNNKRFNGTGDGLTGHGFHGAGSLRGRRNTPVYWRKVHGAGNKKHPSETQ